MVTQENSAVPASIHYHHEGEMHELIITTRYDGNMETIENDTIAGEFAIDALDELTRATVRAWCQAWSAYKHHVYDIDYPSPCVSLGIATSDSDPYCTVWNKDYKDLTITVQSSKPPLYAVIAAEGQARAIAAIHESVKGAAKDKPMLVTDGAQATYYEPDMPPAIGEQPQDTPWRDEPDNITPMPGMPKQNTSGGVILEAWKEAEIFDTKINLPMAKKNESRMAIKGNKLIADEMQYEDGDLIAFPLSKVFATTVGQSEIPVIKVITLGYGSITVWKFKKDGDKNYDYRTVIDAFEAIGIDAEADDFEVSGIDNALVVIKAGHAKDGVKEFKNVYGFWRMP